MKTNIHVNQIINGKILEELLIIIFPGLWMLLIGSTHTKWNSGPLIFFGSIFIVCGYIILGKIRKRNEKTWFPLYIGMVLWGISVFIGWILSDRGTFALLRTIIKIVPLDIQPTFWLTAGLGILFFMWQAFTLKSRFLWAYLGLHASLLMLTITYFFSDNLAGQCTGIYSLLTDLPCSVGTALGLSGFSVIALILLLFPTVLALRFKQALGNTSLILILAIVPAWFEFFFFPLQALGNPLVQSVQELSLDPQFWVNLVNTINKGTYVLIISFMVLIPIGIKFISSERLKAAWVVMTSNLTFILLLVIYIRGTNTLRLMLPELDTNYLVFSLFLGHLTLSIVTVATWGPRQPDEIT